MTGKLKSDEAWKTLTVKKSSLTHLAFHLNKILPHISERFYGSPGQHLNTNICYLKEEINFFCLLVCFAVRRKERCSFPFDLWHPTEVWRHQDFTTVSELQTAASRDTLCLCGTWRAHSAPIRITGLLRSCETLWSCFCHSTLCF